MTAMLVFGSERTLKRVFIGSSFTKPEFNFRMFSWSFSSPARGSRHAEVYCCLTVGETILMKCSGLM